MTAARADAAPQVSLAVTLSGDGVGAQQGRSSFRFPSSATNLEFRITGVLNGRPADAGRVRYKLEGFDSDWHELGADMSLNVRYRNREGATIHTDNFPVVGKSPGWSQDVEHSKFTHRREVITAPPGAEYLTINISSAGPATSIGIYAVTNLMLERHSPDGTVHRESLGEISPPGRPVGPDDLPTDWVRDGILPGMAKLLAIGPQPLNYTFCLMDDDAASHAEWRLVNLRRIQPGDSLVLEWDEVYSIGYGQVSKANYRRLPPGDYQFRVNKLDFTGKPLAYETSVEVVATPPLWQNSWLWTGVIGVVAILAALILRRVYQAKMERRIEQLRQQHAVESERLRIARDIHDDLGARLTHISLISEMTGDDITNVEDARAGFEKISNMARDLVGAIYETIWTVDPKNDYLESLIDFLYEVTQKLCDAANIRCTLNAGEISENVAVSSEIRHGISMAVKEAVHNAVKHSEATKIALKIGYQKRLLTAEVRDDGKGFDLGKIEGHGLENMRARMQSIGGKVGVESAPGQGTTVRFEVPLPQGPGGS
jgi:signal transduction histidine kinase